MLIIVASIKQFKIIPRFLNFLFHPLVGVVYIFHDKESWKMIFNSSYKLSFYHFFFLQILRLFSESTESVKVLKVDLADAKKCLGTRNKQLHQLWYRSVTLRHIISLLDQIEGIAKVCLLLIPALDHI